MSTLKFIDQPAPCSRQLYDDACAGIVQRNTGLDGLRAIYRFGNITTPGISDLDLLFVFEPGTTCERTGLENLPEAHRSLFTHGIMAISEDQLNDNKRFTLWSDMHLLWGKACAADYVQTPENLEQIRIQTAIEFLAANFIDLHVQLSYDIIKLRSFLQHMKGLIYDLEYLNTHEGILFDLLDELRKLIADWFTHSHAEQETREWIKRFIPEFNSFFQASITQYPLFLPKVDSSFYLIARNMRLTPSAQVDAQSSGIVLPDFLLPQGRKAFKVLHRLNRFNFHMPIRHDGPDVLHERFRFLQLMKAYNREHLPNFMTITTSITSKII